MSPRTISLRAMLCAVSLFTLFSLPAVNGALLVYEGFNGYTPGSIHGQAVNGNAQGLSGNYTVFGNSPSVHVTNAGLVFSDLLVSGGSTISATTNASAIGVAVGPGISSTSGSTIYSSYLVSLSGSTNGGAYLRLNNTATASSGSLYFSSAAVNGGPTGTAYSTTFTQGPTLSLNTTYVVIGQFTGVSSGSGTATTWVLSAAQFDFYKAGGFDAAELNAAFTTFGQGSDANQVTARIFQSSTRSGNSFETGDGIQLNLTSSTTGAYKADEIRWGTTMNDVLPLIPEPSAAALLGLAGAVLVFVRKRR